MITINSKLIADRLQQRDKYREILRTEFPEFRYIATYVSSKSCVEAEFSLLDTRLSIYIPYDCTDLKEYIHLNYPELFI